MDQADLLRRIVETLERVSVPYMVVGSVASMAYGDPRMTQDIDVVVDLKEGQVRALCQAFPPDDFYVSDQAAMEAVRRRGQFNIIHSASGNKIDILIVPPGPWGQAELSRRLRMKLLPDLEGYCARPEDVILGKMEYYREGGSEKHLRDITGILKVTGNEVDRQYISLWAERMDLTDIWQAVLGRLTQ